MKQELRRNPEEIGLDNWHLEADRLLKVNNFEEVLKLTEEVKQKYKEELKSEDVLFLDGLVKWANGAKEIDDEYRAPEREEALKKWREKFSDNSPRDLGGES
ncbi:MAG: hypothetical protein AAB657_00500 [Patescibacteria group bacterium]